MNPFAIKYLLEQQKIEQLQKDIGVIKMKMDEEYIQKLNDQNHPIYNIFLLGPSGSGKSTMANELIDVRIVFQSEDEETFDCSSHQNKNMIFKISENSMKSETDMPKEYRVKQYQLWDLPGYFDCRCKYKDLRNIVSSQSLIQKSEYSQILIVIPASQFYDYKLEKLIKILNNIDKSNCEISLSLVISMVNGQKLDYFLKKLNDLLKSNILTTGKDLLLQILVQNRVILFECPKQDLNNEDAYYFCQKNIKQIQQQVFQTDRFKKHDQLKLNPPDETKLLISQIEISQHQQNHARKLDMDLLKEINDCQTINNDHQFIKQLEKIDENMNDIIQKIKQIQNNFIIIGESGAGKSTLCNILMNKKLIFKDEESQFKPIEDQSKIQFKISSDCTTSLTSVPQVEKISDDFQICDVPGFQDTKSSLNDIITCLDIQLLVNNSSAVQIVLLIPEKEISNNKFKNFIEILNQFQDNNFTLTFLITHVGEYQTKRFFCEQLEKLLDLQETKLTDKSKQLLKRSLDKKEEIIHILSQPIESEQKEIYQFEQKQIQLIQENLLNQNLFNKQNLVFSFTDDNKQEIKAQYKILEHSLDKIWKILFKLSIYSQIFKNSFLFANDQQNVSPIYELEKQFIKKYFQNLAHINHLTQLIPDQIQYNNQYDNHKNELKSIIEYLQIDQQLKTIRIFCSYMSVSKLKQILQKYDQYDKVFIYSIVQFQVDESLVQPGLSIYIKTKEFIITSQKNVIIFLKGNDGTAIHPRKAGYDQNNKKNGMNGISGNNGQNGGNLYVDSKLYKNMDLLVIDVSGGNGSDGQDGGDGLDGENGKDAEQYCVDQKDPKFIIHKIEKIIDVKDLEAEKIVKQEDIESQESNTLNKFNAVILENKGSPGTCGGNSGAGGYGGFMGLKGQVKLKNFNHKLKKLIDLDGSNGNPGHPGIVGKGGLQGRNYKRAYWDVKYYKGDISKTKIFFFVAGSILTLGTVFVGLSLSSLVQFLYKDGNWLTNGDFIQENIRADDGKINYRNSHIRKIENLEITMSSFEFDQFIADERCKKTSQIHQFIMIDCDQV